MRGRKQLIVVLCAIVSAVGCGDDERSATSTSSPSGTTSSTTSTTTSTSTSIEPERRVGTASTERKETPGWPEGPSGAAFLSEVRVGRHDGFDRVVFEFDGDPPDYSVRFVELPVRYDPSDEIAELQGAAALLVLMRGTGHDLSTPDARDVYGGPRRIDPPEAGVVMEVVETSDYEGLLQWAVGLPEETPFAVAQLRNPPRLVVDIDHVR
jgi:hypothetical protein